jgi:hypothetical protein
MSSSPAPAPIISSDPVRDELTTRVDVIKKEVDALQIAITGQKQIWYKNASTIISVLALLFSFGTTFVSLRRTESQDVQSSRQELRGLLQRLTALPKENLEASQKYKGEPGALTFHASLVNEENALLSRQAGEISKKLPKGSVSATEYYAIAVAMQNSYNLAGAREFLKLSLDNARDFNDEIATLRSSANLEFIQGRPEAGRVWYQQALNIFSKYPGYDPYTINSTHLLTELYWHSAEAGFGSRDLALQHLQNAENDASKLAPGPATDGYKAQIAQAKQFLAIGGGVAPLQVPATSAFTTPPLAKP